LAAASLAGLPAPAAADDAPYGLNDAGGFRNVLPAGQAGLDTTLQLAQFQATGGLPAHFDDQLPLYTGLVSASPNLTHAQIPNYFKDATFGVKPQDVASVESPRAGVTIVRDKQFGVPHVYGQTRGDVMFGAGYVGAEDRLFLMDVLRHTARAQLSSFAGGAAGNRAMDRTQWAIAPYTEADLQSQVDNAIPLYGHLGVQVVDDVSQYVSGINAYITAALADPVNKLPGEYAAVGQPLKPWNVTDVLAEASLIGGIFGKGGGNELNSALTLQAFERRFGTKSGRAAWSDFREKDDPEAPTTVSARFPYETTSPFATRGLALPDRGSARFTPVAAPATSTSSARAGGVDPRRLTIPNDGSIGSQLMRALRAGPAHASNWELVRAGNSTNGHPLAVMGPQVGYYVPQILMEEDLHGPGIDARGAAFPGVNLYVQLGHGRDYAWSATTATSDNVDTFAEVLCQDDFHYLYRGQCRAMEQLDRDNSWTPSAGDQTPPGSERLIAYRTVHGIVYARGTSGGHKVAFVSARTTYFHEADSALGFIQLNDPNFVTSPERFRQAAANINFAFNWSYVDPSHIAYYQSGWYPQRAAGTSPDFPVLGTGQFDWKGYDPALHTLDVLPFGAHPNAIDPPYLVSWNNKQAPGWAAADDHYAYGAVYRSQLISNHIRDALRGGRKMSIEQLVSAMEEPATEDIRPLALWPTLKRVLGTPRDHRLRGAVALLDRWYARGGHRRDLNGDGRYDDDAAVTLMDAWWPRLLEAEFKPALGSEPFGAVKGMLAFGDPTPGGQPSAPDFAEGWYGYVSKDLRDLLAKSTKTSGRARATAGEARKKKKAKKKSPPRVPGAYSRVYCGGGSLTVCRASLLGSLSDALSVSRQTIYGRGDCANNAQASCFDRNRWVNASGVSIPPFPLQNRPTFQQVVELTHGAAR
jgi:acyl-homoserine lactone acylase PvdQ